MNAFERTTLMVLGAGYSTRFGSDKLSADLDGRPLATHLLSAVEPLRFQQRLLVCRGQPWKDRFAAANFSVLETPESVRSQSASLRLGLSAATSDNILVMLADMPYVTAGHLRLVERTFETAGPGPVASGFPMRPPAMFQRSDLDPSRLNGDRGARDLLAGATSVPANAGILLDIDVPRDLLISRQ